MVDGTRATPHVDVGKWLRKHDGAPAGDAKSNLADLVSPFSRLNACTRGSPARVCLLQCVFQSQARSLAFKAKRSTAPITRLRLPPAPAATVWPSHTPPPHSPYFASYHVSAYFASTVSSTLSGLAPSKGFIMQSTTSCCASSALSRGPSKMTSSCTWTRPTRSITSRTHHQQVFRDHAADRCDEPALCRMERGQLSVPAGAASSPAAAAARIWRWKPWLPSRRQPRCPAVNKATLQDIVYQHASQSQSQTQTQSQSQNATHNTGHKQASNSLFVPLTWMGVLMAARRAWPFLAERSLRSCAPGSCRRRPSIVST